MGLLDGFMPQVAGDLIDMFGVDATLKWQSSVDYDPTQGEVFSQPQETAVKILPPDQYSKSLIGGQSIEQGDLRFIMRPKDGVDPSPDHHVLVFAGKEYVIIVVDPIMTGTEIAAYELRCRG